MKTPALYGKRIVITRAHEQAESFAKKICEFGGTPLIFPAIATAPLQDFYALDAALSELKTFAWIVFTSANGVRFVAERLDTLGLHPHLLNDSRVAAIGSMTARALEIIGVRVEFVPTTFLSVQIARELPLTGDERILLLRADVASNELAVRLMLRGARVQDVPAYRTLSARFSTMDFQQADAITFTSSSTVENFCAGLGDKPSAQLNMLDIFCIGPVTAKTARNIGLNVSGVAEEHTTDGLVRSMCRFYERKKEYAIARVQNEYAG